MAKNKSLLKGLAESLNPMKAMLSMARPMVPAFQKQYDEMDKPVSEGGMLEEGEEKLSLSIMNLGNGLEIVAITFRMNDQQQSYISRVIPLSNLKEL